MSQKTPSARGSMADASTRRLRCAIYTRKSSEEGLEQEFNSLDAQREACEAYIQSQKHEGWEVLPTAYDDGGFSGGSMDRPALKKLLEDISAGTVNVVVVYKVDRLTRALADFAKIVETFDGHGVSFVSVTQQFNTTTSMGRLTLNVLLSFAQFEREVTGERIRDKFAASRKKGMWMGGVVPLGYDLKDRKLLVNKEEAKLVRTLFAQYLELGCFCKLKRWADEEGHRSKSRVHETKGQYGQRPFTPGSLYTLLRNRTYIGEVNHKGQIYPGEHQGILDKELWEKVSALMQGNMQKRARANNVTVHGALSGILRDTDGNKLVATYSKQKGRMYRYYVNQAGLRGRMAGPVSIRMPANDVEVLIRNRLVGMLTSAKEISDHVVRPDDGVSIRRNLQEAGTKLASAIIAKPLQDHVMLMRAIFPQIIYYDTQFEVEIDRAALRSVLLGKEGSDAGKDKRNGSPADSGRATSDPEDRIRFSVKTQIRKNGAGAKMIVSEDGDALEQPTANPALIKAIARGYVWKERLLSGEAASIRDVAKAENLTERYVSKILRLGFLAPGLVEAILDGRQPHEMTVELLMGSSSPIWEASSS